MKKITIYDTTLRDGMQAEGISFSLQDKLDIARILDELGIDIIEGGYPLSNPKDEAFYRELAKHPLGRARVAAFGSTRKANTPVAQDAGMKALLASKAPIVTIVGKGWDFHVIRAHRVTLTENLAMIRDSVAYLKRRREVLFDAEHFFDGFKSNPDYALKTIAAAEDAGADCIVLCDTNGGALPDEIAEIVAEIRSILSVPVGIHCHNDGGMAVANTLAAVRSGAVHVQGTINGFGERCGNADLTVVIPNLVLKMNLPAIAKKNLKKLTMVSRYVYETANMLLVDNQPFVGRSAFAHKGGLHVAAVSRDERTYEHVNPDLVGNSRRLLVGELSGHSTIAAKAAKLALTDDRALLRKVLKQMLKLEHEGYQFEAAEASFELLLRKAAGLHKTFFELDHYYISISKDNQGTPVTEATIKLRVAGHTEHTAADGDGPVNALDAALRKALMPHYPALEEMSLTDYKVRVINSGAGTAARVRVVIELKDASERWGTVGVSENIIDASWAALVDGIEYKLLKDMDTKRGRKKN